MALPAQLLSLAEQQYACFSLDQARSAGVTQDVLDNRRATGEIWSPHRGVYVIAGAPRSYEQQLMAACLAGGPGTVVSGRAAAHVWGLLELDDPPIEISIPRSRSPRFGRGRVTQHRPLDLLPSHTTVRRGLPATNPLRTMVDLAGLVDDETVQEALDTGIALKLFTIRAVDAMRGRLAKRGKNGPGKLKVLLESQVLTEQARTKLEARMARLWKRFGLPAYEFQYVIRTPQGRFVARPDFSIVPPKIIIEVDGWATHASPSAVDADNRRRNRLLAQGWIVLHFSWWRIKNEPAEVAGEIFAVISARSAVS